MSVGSGVLTDFFYVCLQSIKTHFFVFSFEHPIPLLMNPESLIFRKNKTSHSKGSHRVSNGNLPAYQSQRLMCQFCNCPLISPL
jgi:hypothetical protein